MRTRLFAMTFAVVTCLGLSVRGAENYPQFQGATGNGHATATNLPTEFGEDKNRVWKTAIHDTGWSSPVVWGNQIWLTTATDDGRKMWGICVDRKTGKVIHDLLLFENEMPEETRKYNSYASCTPAIEEGRVILHFGSYGTACLDPESGKVLWSRRDLPCNHWRGPGSSPVIFRDMVFIHFDGYDHQYIAALNKQTGETIWKSDRSRDYEYGTDDGDMKKSYATPAVFEIDGKLQLISPAAKAALSYDPTTGKELWRIRYPEHSAACRPLFGDGLVFISSGFPKGQMFAVKPDGTGDVTASHIAWTLSKGVPSMPSPVLIDGTIYMLQDQGTAQAVEAATGNVVWQARVGGNYSASLLYADGKLFAANKEGQVTVFAPGKTYKALGVNKLDVGTHSSPAAVGSSLILRSDTHLYCFENQAATAAP